MSFVLIKNKLVATLRFVLLHVAYIDKSNVIAMVAEKQTSKQKNFF